MGERNSKMSNYPEINQQKPRLEWQPMDLVYLGKVSEVVQQGGGKFTVPAGDPGEPRKQKPTG
jgi:hypothetical protein